MPIVDKIRFNKSKRGRGEGVIQERGITAFDCYCCILVHFSREFGTIPVLLVKKPEMLRIQRNLFPSYVNYFHAIQFDFHEKSFDDNFQFRNYTL